MPLRFDKARAPPDTQARWGEQIKNENISHLTIHDISLQSASKMDWQQFLQLRILWKTHQLNFFTASDVGLGNYMGRAREQLKRDREWQAFLGEVQHRSLSPDCGTFSLVKYYQDRVRDEAQEEVIIDDSPIAFVPISHGTRSHEHPSKGVVEDSPLKAATAKRAGKQLHESSESESEDEDEDEGNDTTVLSPFSPATNEAGSILYPQTPDEQIVNLALVALLNALTIRHQPDVDWSILRKIFVSNFANSSFEARTDGYLRGKGGKVKAIIEVKPYIRSKKYEPIRIQEGAQMAAWVLNDHHRPDTPFLGNHLLVSQNRHEVYLTFATYDEAYLRYLKDPFHPNDPTSFLEMHEYGPWDTYNSSHMNKLGRILLAYTMRASDEQNPGAQGSQPKKQNQAGEQVAEQHAPSGQLAVRPKRAAGLFGDTAK